MRRGTNGKNIRSAIAISLTLALALCMVIAGCAGISPPPPAQTPLENQGRHVLLIASGCGCHGQNFAGWRKGGPDTFPGAAPFGERFVGACGTVPAANITPDPTGIGGWTDEQIERAITDGVDPWGNRLSPAMPYAAYHGMSKSDLLALVTYLHGLRPVHNVVPVAEFSQSAAGAEPLPPAPDERPAGGVELGRYLVRHVCSCADCHGSGAQGPDGEELAGKVLTVGGDKVVAPNLTPDRQTGLGSWSQRDIAHYLRTGSRPDGGLAQSAMAGLIVTSFSHFTPQEAHAVAAYLKCLPPVRRLPN